MTSTTALPPQEEDSSQRRNRPRKGRAQLPDWWLDLNPHFVLDLDDERMKRLEGERLARVYAKHAQEDAAQGLGIDLDGHVYTRQENHHDNSQQDEARRSPVFGGRNFDPTSEGWDAKQWGIDPEKDPDYEKYQSGERLPEEYIVAMQNYARGTGRYQEPENVSLRSVSHQKYGEEKQAYQPSWTKAKLRSTERGKSAQSGHYNDSPNKHWQQQEKKYERRVATESEVPIVQGVSVAVASQPPPNKEEEEPQNSFEPDPHQTFRPVEKEQENPEYDYGMAEPDSAHRKEYADEPLEYEETETTDYLAASTSSMPIVDAQLNDSNVFATADDDHFEVYDEEQEIEEEVVEEEEYEEEEIVEEDEAGTQSADEFIEESVAVSTDDHHFPDPDEVEDTEHAEEEERGQGVHRNVQTLHSNQPPRAPPAQPRRVQERQAPVQEQQVLQAQPQPQNSLEQSMVLEKAVLPRARSGRRNDKAERHRRLILYYVSLAEKDEQAGKMCDVEGNPIRIDTQKNNISTGKEANKGRWRSFSRGRKRDATPEAVRGRDETRAGSSWRSRSRSRSESSEKERDATPNKRRWFGRGRSKSGSRSKGLSAENTSAPQTKRMMFGGLNYKPGSQGWDPKAWGTNDRDPDYAMYSSGQKLPPRHVAALTNYAKQMGQAVEPEGVSHHSSALSHSSMDMNQSGMSSRSLSTNKNTSFSNDSTDTLPWGNSAQAQRNRQRHEKSNPGSARALGRNQPEQDPRLQNREHHMNQGRMQRSGNTGPPSAQQRELPDFSDKQPHHKHGVQGKKWDDPLRSSSQDILSEPALEHKQPHHEHGLQGKKWDDPLRSSSQDILSEPALEYEYKDDDDESTPLMIPEQHPFSKKTPSFTDRTPGVLKSEASKRSQVDEDEKSMGEAVQDDEALQSQQKKKAFGKVGDGDDSFDFEENSIYDLVNKDDGIAIPDLAPETQMEPQGPLKVIVGGAPASGRCTQCKLLKEKYGVVHLSTFEMLWEAIDAGNEIGKQAMEFMGQGQAVPDAVMIGMIKDRLSQKDCVEKGWVLESFPRTPAQADAMSESGISPDCYIFLDVANNVLVERALGRRMDPDTGDIYHLKFSPPKDKKVAARLVQLPDDTEEKINVVLNQFHSYMQPIMDNFRDITKVINGNTPPSDVLRDVSVAIGLQRDENSLQAQNEIDQPVPSEQGQAEDNQSKEANPKLNTSPKKDDEQSEEVHFEEELVEEEVLEEEEEETPVPNQDSLEPVSTPKREKTTTVISSPRLEEMKHKRQEKQERVESLLKDHTKNMRGMYDTNNPEKTETHAAEEKEQETKSAISQGEANDEQAQDEPSGEAGSIYPPPSEEAAVSTAQPVDSVDKTEHQTQGELSTETTSERTPAAQGSKDDEETVSEKAPVKARVWPPPRARVWPPPKETDTDSGKPKPLQVHITPSRARVWPPPKAGASEPDKENPARATPPSQVRKWTPPNKQKSETPTQTNEAEKMKTNEAEKMKIRAATGTANSQTDTREEPVSEAKLESNPTPNPGPPKIKRQASDKSNKVWPPPQQEVQKPPPKKGDFPFQVREWAPKSANSEKEAPVKYHAARSTPSKPPAWAQMKLNSVKKRTEQPNIALEQDNGQEQQHEPEQQQEGQEQVGKAESEELAEEVEEIIEEVEEIIEEVEEEEVLEEEEEFIEEEEIIEEEEEEIIEEEIIEEIIEEEFSDYEDEETVEAEDSPSNDVHAVQTWRERQAALRN